MAKKILLVDDNGAFMDNIYAEELNDLINQAVSENAYTYLTKPLNISELLVLLNKVPINKRAGTIVKPSLEK